MADLANRGPLGQKQPKADKPKGMRSKKKAGHQSKMTKNAKGKACQLQLTGCRGDTEHTIFAHYRRFNWGAMGQKPNDMLGCFACDICHDKQEKRDPEATYENLLRAMGNTLLIQHKDGKVFTT